jgi:hypothetical protein
MKDNRREQRRDYRRGDSYFAKGQLATFVPKDWPTTIIFIYYIIIYDTGSILKYFDYNTHQSDVRYSEGAS